MIVTQVIKACTTTQCTQLIAAENKTDEALASVEFFNVWEQVGLKFILCPAGSGRVQPSG